jgi:hypothetical protein
MHCAKALPLSADRGASTKNLPHVATALLRTGRPQELDGRGDPRDAYAGPDQRRDRCGSHPQSMDEGEVLALQRRATSDDNYERNTSRSRDAVRWSEQFIGSAAPAKTELCSVPTIISQRMLTTQRGCNSSVGPRPSRLPSRAALFDLLQASTGKDGTR